MRRSDDNEASIRSRLNDYHEKTSPILELFSRKELVIKVDGTQAPEAVQRELRQKLNCL
jgi:adenylate kinase